MAVSAQQPQVDALKRGVDVLAATPGRLLDLMNQQFIHLNRIEYFVLDEADRMLDMGFIHDVKRVIKRLPDNRQTMLFSATMPPAVQELSRSMLIDPVKVEANPQATTVESIAQSIYFVESGNKRALLKHILRDPASERVLVFTRTKHRANNLAKQLNRARIPAEAIHGNKSQTARTRALAQFKSGRTAVLVATDIAARGLDIDSVTHVINFDLPNIPESYVHRIGRPARAGASRHRLFLLRCQRTEVPARNRSADTQTHRGCQRASLCVCHRSAGPGCHCEYAAKRQRTQTTAAI